MGSNLTVRPVCGWLATGLLAFTILFAKPTAAANLVSDPSFENATVTGQLGANTSLGDGWSSTTALFVNNNSSFVHTGNMYVHLSDGETGPAFQGGVEQTLATTPGASYVLDFFADNDAAVNTFAVTFGGVLVTGIPTILPNTGTGPAAYDEYTATVTATSNSSILAFNGTSDSGAGEWIRLDDVSVTPAAAPVPLPRTWPAGLLTLAIFAAWHGHRRVLSLR